MTSLLWSIGRREKRGVPVSHLVVWAGAKWGHKSTRQSNIAAYCLHRQKGKREAQIYTMRASLGRTAVCYWRQQSNIPHISFSPTVYKQLFSCPDSHPKVRWSNSTTILWDLSNEDRKLVCKMPLSLILRKLDNLPLLYCRPSRRLPQDPLHHLLPPPIHLHLLALRLQSRRGTLWERRNEIKQGKTGILQAHLPKDMVGILGEWEVSKDGIGPLARK